eukprot:CAMPEP_0206365910 /NCGR_PEP_ID=MMETSP0294-20121207/3147_1 /ASSEMBLY_ACC=CAM_ASM_000327 /TAXON_ID=39354 /ORGANISM="Heterosigma akashiwo, Strain CCMP2393" /LENGTH=54 /DNA_ID=CAMNT_0053811893 /DNA_START=600 /DNA_END=764 /DNA_ORIENTATION=-
MTNLDLLSISHTVCCWLLEEDNTTGAACPLVSTYMTHTELNTTISHATLKKALS